VSRELKENQDLTETYKTTLERLKEKLHDFKTNTVQQYREQCASLERENARLQGEIQKYQLGESGELFETVLNSSKEIDRAKDVDDLIPHYKLAVMKVKAQATALREKLEQINDEKFAIKQELVRNLLYSPNNFPINIRMKPKEF
jgi:FtsZ-binding cell division protein ZapB